MIPNNLHFYPRLVFLDGSLHIHITLQLLLGCLHGLGPWKERVWIPRTKINVPKEILLLHSNVCRFSIAVHVDAHATTPRLRRQIRAP